MSPAGFEPTAPRLGILCSILLSYGDGLCFQSVSGYRGRRRRGLGNAQGNNAKPAPHGIIARTSSVKREGSIRCFGLPRPAGLCVVVLRPLARMRPVVPHRIGGDVLDPGEVLAHRSRPFIVVHALRYHDAALLGNGAAQAPRSGRDDGSTAPDDPGAVSASRGTTGKAAIADNNMPVQMLRFSRHVSAYVPTAMPSMQTLNNTWKLSPSAAFAAS